MSPAAARAVASRLHARAIGMVVGCAALACGALLAASAGPASAATSSSSSGSTFITQLDTSVSTFNPFLAFQQGEIDTLQMIYPTLTFGKENNFPGPYLAKSWTTSANKLTWTFHLQTGLKWSDGQPLTSKDVAWTYNLMMHNATAATANGSLVEYFKTVTAPNPATVVITTKKPLANMLSLVGAPGIPIVPEHIWKSHVKGLGQFTNTTTPVVGYGPYRFTGYKAGQSVTLTANPDFQPNAYMSKPHYGTLILDYFANDSAALAALRNGTIDSTYQLTATEYKSLAHAPGITTYQTNTNDWIGVEVNSGAKTRSGTPIGTGNPILKDPRVRRAIALGIDKQTILDKVFGGFGTATGSYLTVGIPQFYYRPPANLAQNYSPAKANALLDSAGYPKGKNGYRVDSKTGKELSFRLGIHSDNSDDAATANYLVGFMKAIGIKLTVQSQSNTQLNDNLAIGDWDLLMDQWPEGTDPTYLLSIQTCGVLPTDKHGTNGNTDAFFCNKKYDRLYAAEQEEFNPAKRAADIKEMGALLYAADDDIILYDHNYLYATRTDFLKGYRYGSPDAKGFYPLQNYELGWINGVPASSSSGGGSSNTALIVIIIVVVVIVLLGGGFLASRRRRATAEERE